jgi:hypothetical protein
MTFLMPTTMNFVNKPGKQHQKIRKEREKAKLAS